MTMESWIMILALLAMVVFRQLGERRFTIKSIIVQIAILGYFTFKYVKNVPTGGINTQILVGAIAVGIVFGLFMLLATKRYRKDGKNYVKSGIPYLILWIVGLGSKVVLVDYITKWNVRGSDIFIMQHHINPNVIAPAFMFFTIAMILVRTIGIYVTFAMLNKKAKMEVVAA
ncbi:hypothetical protein [uncultured Clostridium sp.]|jgi:membrane protein CcdC involved in cytochrome C biogenesis|uniref:hypothetical protein n=1 Tax=uncultured Clostridium sp. TaxID=59620 RepID=UPI00261C416B|nr:hypothetical protein [uncultured Clostridium sp.]